MRKTKMNLDQLSVKSFVTERSAVKGGKPYTTDPALDTDPKNTALRMLRTIR